MGSLLLSSKPKSGNLERKNKLFRKISKTKEPQWGKMALALYLVLWLAVCLFNQSLSQALTLQDRESLVSRAYGLHQSLSGEVSVALSNSTILWIVAHRAPLSMGFSSKNTGVGCHCLLQGVFPI